MAAIHLLIDKLKCFRFGEISEHNPLTFLDLTLSFNQHNTANLIVEADFVRGFFWKYRLCHQQHKVVTDKPGNSTAFNLRREPYFEDVLQDRLAKLF